MLQPTEFIEVPGYSETEAIVVCHQNDNQPGWRVRVRKWFRYHKPDAYYQATVAKLVTEQSDWIDVGGGKTLFPGNPELSRILANRCHSLVGVDPSNNILQNTLVHERFQGVLEDFSCEQKKHIATLRMVAEHVEEPARFASALARLIMKDGYVVLLTPYRWSPVAILSSLIPNRLHAFFIKILPVSPARKEEDIFPTHYRMNTPPRLRKIFEEAGFQEVALVYLDDCVVLQRFRITFLMEMIFWKVLNRLGISYPEKNILAIFKRN
jgi:Methyltransferase domain